LDRVLASRRGIAQVRGQRLLGVSGGLRASLPGAGADQEGEELEGKCTREARGLGGLRADRLCRCLQGHGEGGSGRCLGIDRRRSRGFVAPLACRL